MQTKLPQSWQDHDAKVKPYVWSHRAFSWAQTLLFWGVLVWGLSSFRALHYQWSWMDRGFSGFGLWLVYFGSLILLWKVFTLPFSVGGQWVEKEYALSRQSWGSWFVDFLKGLGVGAVLGAMALGLLYLAVVWGEQLWWVLAWFFLFLFSILLAQLAPVLLIPLFMTMKPMPEGSLKSRLLALCTKYGIVVKDVYHLGMGEKTEKGNAAFMGLGRTKRIVIGDTLYEKYAEEEVEAVFAHELGHQVHNDLWKGIGVGAVSLFLCFWVADFLTHAYVLPHFMVKMIDPLGLLLFFLVLSVVQTPFNFAQAAYSRSRERAADAFASQKLGFGQPLGQALEKLTFQNFGYFKPNRLVEFLTYSHPAPWRRILGLKTKAV